MASPGTYISAIGHVGLIVWLVAGWGFDAEPLPFEVTEVSVVSGEEFDQLMAARTPDPGDAPPETPVQPVIEDAPPPAPEALPTPTERAATPQPVAPPEVETPPPPAPLPIPPAAEVADAAPAEPTPPAPSSAAPTVSMSPVPRPPRADRIAATPSAPPPPDARIDDVASPAAIPDDAPAPEEVVEEPREETAPPETATEIAIADEKPSGAVQTSVRPLTRPTRPEPRPTPAPEPQPEPEPEPEPLPVPDAAMVADALAAALAEENPSAAAPNVPEGPPLTGAERDTFRIAVNRCWNVDPGSVAARVTIEVGFELTPAGRIAGDVRLEASSGDPAATRVAFEAARRAILRCQGEGYDLPAAKYEQWKEVVITFDPSGMRMR